MRRQSPSSRLFFFYALIIHFFQFSYCSLSFLENCRLFRTHNKTTFLYWLWNSWALSSMYPAAFIVSFFFFFSDNRFAMSYLFHPLIERGKKVTFNRFGSPGKNMFYNLFCSLKTCSLCSLACSLQHISCAISVKGRFEKSFKSKAGCSHGLVWYRFPFYTSQKEAGTV